MNPATRRLRWWKEVLAIVAFDLVYEWTSAKAAGAHAVASTHAGWIVDAERSLGIFREHAIQQWFLPQRLLIEASDLFYSTVHFVLPVVTLVWLFRRFPERYIRWRNALAWMTGLGLIGFITFPLLPPRFLPSSFGFVDTLNVVGGIGSWDSALMKDAGNLYAAMPSLHIAWALWCVFALFPVIRRRWIKALLVLHPFVTLFTIVVTANHYFLDAAGGVVVFSLGVAISQLPRPAFTVSPIAALGRTVHRPAWITRPAAWVRTADVWLTSAPGRLVSLVGVIRLSARLRRSTPSGPGSGTQHPPAAPAPPADGDDTPSEVSVSA
ncbi:MAG TPA: phosphatase PAP2 family protein [Acidimicrobiales bacterium]